MAATASDVLILNQDVWFTGDQWLELLAEKSAQFGIIGDGVFGHPAWLQGYVQGTFMYIRREVITAVGGFNESLYPLWGATCEYQLAACRKGFKALPLSTVPGMNHERRVSRYGSAITEALKREPTQKAHFIHTPPEVSVIVPCYNYGKFLPDLISSMVGGSSSIGALPGQTFRSWELIIVDDCSTDETAAVIASYVDPWKGIRSVRLPHNVGTAAANNAGIRASYGKAITILGADDMMSSGRLETLYSVWSQDKTQVVYDDMYQLTRGALKPLKMTEYDFEKSLYKNQMHAGIMFSKKAWEAAGGYPEIMRDGREDWAFNIALGLAGYCGSHVPKPGYIYRRDGHNRTLVNTRGDWYQIFLRKLQGLFPDAYKGVFPMACCGGRRAHVFTRSENQSLARAVSRLPGSEGMVLIEYIGANAGAGSYWGESSKKMYPFGGKHRLGYVDKNDVGGFLDIREGRKLAFRIAKVEEIKPHVIPVIETKPGDERDFVEAPEPVAEVTEAIVEEPKKRGRRRKTDD